MIVLCPYCGAKSGDRDQASGRCGKCGSFFTGQEEVINTSTSTTQATLGQATVVADVKVSPSQMPLSTIIPTVGMVANSSPSDNQPSQISSASSSEELIKPRRLSPQFQRQVMMTWQPAITTGVHGAERTLSSGSSADTKQNYSSLTIGTRKISTDRNKLSADYQLQEIIGEGSMGNVWSARQTSLDRNVAIKVPKPELANSGSVGESQFISEVVVTGKLEHPNIVPIYELGRDANGVPFYSMKHVQGQPWNELIADRSEQENIEILMKVCDALAFAHDRDFLHRDIKPHNVMVGEFGEVSVMDWGIAVSLSKDPQRDWAATASGPAGTPAYMAPEMAAYNPSQLGVVSDVYLLGAVLYEIVTGSPPHPRTTNTGEALLAAAANDIVPTSKTGELVDIARRAMATNVEDRYQTVQAFQDALREYRSHGESKALAVSAAEHLARAKSEENSDEYARARFAYEEAIRLWAGNSPAIQGLRIATLAHAQNALLQENYELGISLLDRNEPEHRALLANLKRRRSARQRLKWFARLAAATAIIAVLTVIVVMVRSNGKLNREKEIAIKAEAEAKDQRAKAVDEKQKAKAAKAVAVSAKDMARLSEAVARQEERKAAEASYVSDIGLVAESIRRNSFPNARTILEITRSQLRHLEWGILKHAASPGAVLDLAPEKRIQAVASSINGRTVLAAGTESGDVILWIANQETATDAPVVFDRTAEFSHGSRLSALALSAKGDYLATAGLDPKHSQTDGKTGKYLVKIWEIKEGKRQQVPTSLLVGHSAEVLSVVFSKNGNWVLTSAADRTARVWDRSTGAELWTMPDHLEKKVWSARFSPDEKSIVTACDDGRVRVWQHPPNSQLKKTHDFRGHNGPVYAAIFTSDGQTVLSGGYDRRLRKLAITREDSNKDTNLAPPNNVESLLAENSIDAAEEGDMVGEKDQQHAASIRSISSSLLEDGTENIVTSSNDNTIHVWKPTKDGWERDKVLRGHGRWVNSCTFANSGKYVISGAFDGVKLWILGAYNMPRELFPNSELAVGNSTSERGPSSASKTIYSPDGCWVATAYANGTVAIWNLKSGSGKLLVNGHSFLTTTGNFYANGGRLLTSAGDNTTRLWDVARGTSMETLVGTGWRGAAAVAWREQDSTALIATGSDNRLVPAWLWQIQDGMPIVRQPLLAEYARSMLSNWATDAMTNSEDPAGQTTFVSRRLNEFDKFQRLQRRIPDVTAIAFSPSGERLLLGNADGNSFLLQIEDDSAVPRELAKLPGVGGAVRAAAFLPSGESFITVSNEGQLTQWDATQGQLQRQFPWTGPVTSMAVSNDGKYVVVGHAPIEGKVIPVARLFNIEGEQVRVEAEFLQSNPAGSRDWKSNPPIVQSIQFADKGRRALLGLFFPASKNAPNKVDTGAKLPAGYSLGYWNCDDEVNDFYPLSSEANAEVSATAFGQGVAESQLLVVGGKGAKLLGSSANEEKFTKLTASFRPATAITTLDFSFDPISRSSNRLVAGDSEGNIRVWDLTNGEWSESSGAAAHLTGHHNAPIIATCFDPQRQDRMLTADKSAKLSIWKFDEHWTAEPLQEMQVDGQPAHCALFSPNGNRIFMGRENKAQIWRRSDRDHYKTSESFQTGKVQTTTFSNDGSWIVTSDGDKAVTFWDCNGQSIASLPENVTENVTTLALSWDRRRLCTGHHNKRVVVWDTSKLVDAQVGDDPIENGKLIKELLALEEHGRAVTSIALSPNSRDLLSTGEEGRTIIFAGNTIWPISLTFSRSQFVYSQDSSDKRVDAWVIVNDPSRLADFSNAEITVSLKVDAKVGERLTFVSSSSSTSAIVETAEDGTVLYRPYPDAKPLTIGKLTSNSEGLKHIVLNEAADACSVQALLRSLAYEIDGTQAEDSEQTVEVKVANISDLDNNQVETLEAEVRIDYATKRESNDNE